MNIVQLQTEFRNFGEAEVTKMKDMQLPIYKVQHGVNMLLYTPLGFMVCESVLDGQPLAGLRMTMGKVVKCPAEFPEYRDFLHEADSKNPALPQMNALIRFLSTLIAV